MDDPLPAEEPSREESVGGGPNKDNGGRSPRFRTRTVALWALAIAIGHVIYHALRDHVFPDAY